MDLVFFELNNWFAGRDYPPDGNLNEWVESGKFNNVAFCKQNKLCVVAGTIDMSENWCVTASKEWVLNFCPELLDGKEYTYIVYVYANGRRYEKEERGDCSQFLRYRDEYGDVWGRFGWPFLEYSEENFGVKWYKDDAE